MSQEDAGLLTINSQIRLTMNEERLPGAGTGIRVEEQGFPERGEGICRRNQGDRPGSVQIPTQATDNTDVSEISILLNSTTGDPGRRIASPRGRVRVRHGVPAGGRGENQAVRHGETTGCGRDNRRSMRREGLTTGGERCDEKANTEAHRGANAQALTAHKAQRTQSPAAFPHTAPSHTQPGPIPLHTAPTQALAGRPPYLTGPTDPHSLSDLTKSHTDQRGTHTVSGTVSVHTGSEEEHPGEAGEPESRMDYLLQQLKQQVIGLRDEGSNLSRQVWLLNVTCEDFLHVQYPGLTQVDPNQQPEEALPGDTRSVRNTRSETHQSVTHTQQIGESITEGIPDTSSTNLGTPLTNTRTGPQYSIPGPQYIPTDHPFRAAVSPLRFGECLNGAQQGTIGPGRARARLVAPGCTPVRRELLKHRQFVGENRRDCDRQSDNTSRVSEAKPKLIAGQLEQPCQSELHHTEAVSDEVRHLSPALSYTSGRMHRSSLSDSAMAYPADNHTNTGYCERTHGIEDHTQGLVYHGQSVDATPERTGFTMSEGHEMSQDSITDRLVRDVVRLTFFGGETSTTPVRRQQASPAERPILPGDSQPLRPATLNLPRPPVRRALSPNTIYSSGYDSEPENRENRDAEIDALFCSNNSMQNATVLEHDSQYNRDEFVISPDCLYLNEHSPDKHQTHSNSNTSPINSNGNTPRGSRSMQCGYTGQSSHSSGKISTSSPRQSPSARKLNKVSKSMKHIISDLGNEINTEATKLKNKVIEETDLDSSGLSEANSSVHVPLTSTPVPSKEQAPTVTYSSYEEVMGRNSEINHLASHSCPSTPDNHITHQAPLHVACNQSSFTHRPTGLFTLTPDRAGSRGQQSGTERVITGHNSRGSVGHSAHQQHTEGLNLPQHQLHGQYRQSQGKDRMCEANTQVQTQHTSQLTDSMFSTLTSQSEITQSLLTTNMLQHPAGMDSDTTVMSDLSLTDLRYKESLHSVRDSVQSIRVRPKELMFDEDFYLRPRNLDLYHPGGRDLEMGSRGSEFNSLRSSGSESSLADGTLLLNHLQNSEFWNSRGTSCSSIPCSSLNSLRVSQMNCPSSPRNSTVSSDSGRGSTSAMDIAELRCDSELDGSDASFMFGDEEPIYETIPDHLVSDSDATMCEDLCTRWNQKQQWEECAGVENTYATIDCDVMTPSAHVMCSSFHGYPSPPPEPPARNSSSRATLPIRGHQGHRVTTRGSSGSLSRRQSVRQAQGIRRTDVISHNPYHVYTVGDVLESFHRLAANIPASPPPKPSMDDQDEEDISELYAQIRKPIRTHNQPQHHSVRRRGSDATAGRKHREIDSNQNRRVSSSQVEGHRNTERIAGRKRSNSNYHQMAPAVRTVAAPKVTPVWRSSISQIQGTLC